MRGRAGRATGVSFPSDRGCHCTPQQRTGRPDERLIAGRHRLFEPLGRGGLGTVWRGRIKLLPRDVAIREVALPSGPERTILAERGSCWSSSAGDGFGRLWQRCRVGAAPAGRASPSR